MATWPAVDGDDGLARHLNMRDPTVIEQRRPRLERKLAAAIKLVEKRCGSQNPTAVPEPLAEAVLYIAGQLWSSQRNPDSRSGIHGGEETVPRGFAIPRAATELMHPYRVIPVG